ncbi:phosphoribosylformylglycinamidine synthase I [Chloroflexota bacterium]
MSKVRTLMLRAPGTNRDVETIFAFEQAGADVSLVHINRLIRGEERLSDYQILVIPGGFSYGDDIAAGMVLANELRLKLGDDITRFIKDGGLILGICNGFQALVKAGFLPELSPDSSPRVTLTNNDSGKFECRWVHLAVNKKSPCVFTRGMDRLYVPIAHGEGKIVTLGDGIADSNIALYYSDELGNITADYPHNPNGSEKNIAGLCDASGRVFGLMPHPEDHIHGTQHPHWTRLGAKEYGDGFKIFQNAVEWAKSL